MGFLSKFENKMEDGIEGAAGAIGRSSLSPVQITKKAEKQMRREKIVGAGKQYAPTLYTVLVSPEDDSKLFKYYPTLAGETETYLLARARELGYVMDGQPLVRFISDPDLKRGKFDVVAEMVASAIVDQLRDDEMRRYGIPVSSASKRSGAPVATAAQRERNLHPNMQPLQNLQSEAKGPRAQAAKAAVPAQVPKAQAVPSQVEEGHVPLVIPGIDLSGLDVSADISLMRDEDLRQIARESAAETPEEQIDEPISYSEDMDDQDLAFRAAQEQGGEFAFAVFRAKQLRENAENPQSDPEPEEEPRPIKPAIASPVVEIPAYLDEYESSPQVKVHKPSKQPIPSSGAGVDALFGSPKQAQPTSQYHVYLYDEERDRAYNLTGAEQHIGRESVNDIVVPDINVSRVHAGIHREPNGTWVIKDLGSTNGVFINGRQIQSAPLRDADMITLGTTTLEFQLLD